MTTFDAVIVEHAEAGRPGRDDLVVAHVHRGATLVALRKEEDARNAFGQALRLEPNLRLTNGDFPDRVVRAFEAARAGKTKSVMERPTGAPKKAGLGGAPDPLTQVVPIYRVGPGEITLTAAVPAPGSAVSGCGTDAGNCAGRFAFGLGVRTILSPTDITGLPTIRGLGPSRDDREAGRRYLERRSIPSPLGPATVEHQPHDQPVN